MVKRFAESSQCYKTGEGWYNQGKFEVDSLYNTILKVTLYSGFVHTWLTKGRTASLQKDKSTSNIASNYRSITLLPLMWKLLKSVNVDKI